MSIKPINLKKNFMMLLLLMAATACSYHAVDGLSYPPTPTPYHTPNIPNWGSTPEFQHTSLVDGFSCEIVPTKLPDPSPISWRGLTIGITKFDDLINILTNEKGTNYEWNTVVGNLSFSIPFDPVNLDQEQHNGSSAEFCFAAGKLATMNVFMAIEFQESLSSFITKYGKPDRVTWTNDYWQRSAIWAETGLLAIIDFGENEAQVYEVILFSPIPRCELTQSWVFAHLPQEATKFNGDSGVYVPEVEDPTGVEKGLRDCARPTLTP